MSRFNIGDTVFFICENMIMRGVVKEVKQKINDGPLFYEYDVLSKKCAEGSDEVVDYDFLNASEHLLSRSLKDLTSISYDDFQEKTNSLIKFVRPQKTKKQNLISVIHECLDWIYIDGLKGHAEGCDDIDDYDLKDCSLSTLLKMITSLRSSLKNDLYKNLLVKTQKVTYEDLSYAMSLIEGYDSMTNEDVEQFNKVTSNFRHQHAEITINHFKKIMKEK